MRRHTHARQVHDFESEREEGTLGVYLFSSMLLTDAKRFSGSLSHACVRVSLHILSTFIFITYTILNILCTYQAQESYRV